MSIWKKLFWMYEKVKDCVEFLGKGYPVGVKLVFWNWTLLFFYVLNESMNMKSADEIVNSFIVSNGMFLLLVLTISASIMWSFDFLKDWIEETENIVIKGLIRIGYVNGYRRHSRRGSSYVSSHYRCLPVYIKPKRNEKYENFSFNVKTKKAAEFYEQMFKKEGLKVNIAENRDSTFRVHVSGHEKKLLT